MKALLKKPLLHFLLLGSVLFALDQWWQWRESYRIAAPTADQVAQRLQQWVAQSRMLPDDGIRQRAYDTTLTDEILFQEALRRNLHISDGIVRQRLLRDADFLNIAGNEQDKLQRAYELQLYQGDEVIRRQLIQRMEQLGRHAYRPMSGPSEAELKAHYQQRLEQWQRPPQVSIEHHFFSADRGEATSRAQAALAQLQAGKSISADPFLQGFQFLVETPAALDQRMGQGFAEAVLQRYQQLRLPAAQRAQYWLGPIPSAYGQHLVRVFEFRPAYQQGFEAVRREVEALWWDQQEQASLAMFIDALRDRYRVVQQ